MPRRPTLNKAGCDLSGQLREGATKAITSDCFLKHECVCEQLALTSGVCLLSQDSGPRGFGCQTWCMEIMVATNESLQLGILTGMLMPLGS